MLSVQVESGVEIPFEKARVLRGHDSEVSLPVATKTDHYFGTVLCCLLSITFRCVCVCGGVGVCVCVCVCVCVSCLIESFCWIKKIFLTFCEMIF